MNFGRDASTFKYYTMCGLQEGFEPFAVNMNRDVAMWFSKRLPTFVNVPKNHPHIEVILYFKETLILYNGCQEGLYHRSDHMYAGLLNKMSVIGLDSMIYTVGSYDSYLVFIQQRKTSSKRETLIL